MTRYELAAWAESPARRDDPMEDAVADAVRQALWWEKALRKAARAFHDHVVGRGGGCCRDGEDCAVLNELEDALAGRKL